MSIITVTIPQQGQVTIIDTLKPHDELVFDFASSHTLASRSGADLVLFGIDGGIVIIKDFIAIAESPQSSSVVIDGYEFSWQALLAKIDQELPVPVNELVTFIQGGGHFQEYVPPAPLIGGVEHLNPLGTTYWERHTDTYPDLDTDSGANLAGVLNRLPLLNSLLIELVEDSPSDVFRSGDVLTDADLGDGGGRFQWANPESQSQYGTLIRLPNGQFTYTLDNSRPIVQALGEGETVTEKFLYSYTDKNGDVAHGTLTIVIRGTNDLPTVAAAADSVTEDLQTVASGNLPAPVDVDNHDILAFIPQTNAPGAYGSFTVDASGGYTYTLNNSLAAVQALGVGEQLTETFTYTVSDGHGGTATNTITITIHGTNDIPTVAAAANSVTEDLVLTATGTLPTPVDIDSHDTPVFIAQTGVPGAYGSLTLNADGTYTYVLNNSMAAVQKLGVGEHLTDTFTYTVSDGHGGTATNTLTITINGTNDLLAVDASIASVTEDTHISTSGTLPPPTDVDIHDTLTFIPQTNAPGAYGSFTVNASGGYTYTLNNSLAAIQALGVGEQLTETFTYTASDGHGGTASNTITITIHGTNDIPTVAAATDSVTEDTQTVASGTLPAPADTDAHDTPVFIAQTGTPGAYGSLTLNAAGNYTYSLNNSLAAVQNLGVGEQLTETFTYTVSDGHGGTATNTLTITINGTNDTPTVAATTDSVTEDTQTVASGTLPTPTDADLHDTLTFTPQTNAPGAYGSFTVNAAGVYTYILDNSLAAIQALGVGEQLTETFTYTVNDGHGGTATNTITITIHGTNDAPTVAAATDSLTEDTQTVASGTLPSPADTDTHDTPVFIVQTGTAGSYGSLNLDAAGNYTYSLNNSLAAVQNLGVGEQLTETFTYTVSDGKGGTATNTLTITINGTNDTPAVAATTDSVTEDTQTIASGTLPTPTDADLHDTLTFTPQTNAPGAYGSFTVDASGVYTYTLDNSLAAIQALGVGEQLTETFTYTVNDGHGGTATNTITITIHGTNDAPTVAAATDSLTEDTQTVAIGTLPAPADTDTHDTPVFIVQAGTAGSYGSLNLDAAGNYTYSLNNSLAAVQNLGVGEQLTETFTYTVSDGHGGTVTNTLTLTINGTNDTPAVAATTDSVTEDTQTIASGNLPTPTDADIHDILTFTPQTNAPGAYGSFTVDAAGVYTYTLNNSLAAVQALGVGEQLTETFTYTVNDGHGATASNTITITIHGTNDAPTVAAATDSVAEDTQTVASGTLPAPADTDTHDIPVFITQTGTAGAYGSLNLDAAGNYTYSLNNALAAVQNLGVGEQLTETFTYTVSDGKGGTATNTLTITINGTNDTPAVAATTDSVDEDTKTSTSGTLPTPTDADLHDTLTFTPQTNAPGAYGSFTVDAAGVYTYTLNNSLAAVQALGVGEQLTETFTYTVNDGHGGTASNTITITINGTNDAPTVAAATDAVTEDTNISTSGNLPTPADVDVNDTPVFITQAATPGAYGSFTLTAAGAYTYALNNSLAAVQALGVGEHLTDTFTYTVSDGKGGTASNTITVTINGTNDAPVVGASTASVSEDTVLTASGILPAPTDADTNDTPVFVPQTATPGSYGSFTLNTAGGYTYTLNNSLTAVQALGAGETLTDTLTYTVSDGKGGTATNTLTVTINGTNDAPLVSATATSVTEDTVLSASGTLPAPTDADIHDTLVFVPQTAAPGSYGSFTVNSAGAYTYTLNNSLAAVQALGVGEKLTDTFTYTVNDGKGGTASNTITVTINGTNDLPTVGAAANSVTEDTQTTATGTLPTPADVDIHDTLLFTTQTNAPGAYGKLTLAADGSYTYTLTNSLPAVQALGVGETLTDTFTYTVNDGKGGTAINTLTVTINGTNDAPLVIAAAASVTEDTVLTASGTLPAPTDVDIHDTPVFVPQTAAPGSYGSFTVNAAGAYTYTLNNSLSAVQALGVGEKLTDTFTYTVSDGKGGTGTNTITVTINGTNDLPTVGAATTFVTEDTKITTTGNLPVPQDIDIHDVLTFTPQTNAPGSYGSFTVNAAGVYTYNLSNSLAAVQGLGVGETLTDTFTYTVNDGKGGTATNTITVTINGTNDAPVVSAATAAVTEDTVLSASGTLPVPTDVDIHDTPVFVPQTAAPGSYGSFTVNSAGAYTYTLNNSLAAVQALGVGEKLTDTFTYMVSDGKGGTGTNTITVTINGTNDIPTVAAATASVTEDTQITATGTLPTPADIDIHDTLLFTTQTNAPGTYGKLTLAANGSYTYTLTNSLAAVQGLGVGEKLTDTFTYTVNDGKGGTATNTLTVTINGTNDAPLVSAATASVTEDTVLTATGTLPAPTDVDIHDTPVFVPQTAAPGSYGSFTVNSAGAYTYTLNNSLASVQALGVGEKLTDTFTYTVSDGKGGTGTNTIVVTINGTNDIPTVAAATASVTEDTKITATGTLPTPADIDIHDTLTFTTQTNAPGAYGKLNLAANGSYTYTLTNSLAAVQRLGVGQTLTDTFTYTVNDGKGGTATNTLTVTINGTNDRPVVAAATASVTEDTVLTASGTLPAPTDVDANDSPTFVPLTNKAGSYGTLNLNAAGVYTYNLNNSLAAVQRLGVGEKLTETFTYTVTDGRTGGTGTNTLTITINGTNDIPTVAATTASVNEDTKITATGNLPTPQDVDVNDVLTFTPQTNAPGSYGSFTVNAAGAYTYNLNNSLAAVQRLGVGQTLTDTFTYTVNDGKGGTATNTITVTINGTNDAPVVAAATTAVTEDTVLTASGTLPAPTDVDATDTPVFIAQNAAPGSYGSFTLNASGNYTYTLNNSMAAVQALGVGEKLTDTFTYTVSDGKGGTGTNTITVTINGTNDIPTVAATTASVTEDTKITTTGNLPTPQDVDVNDVLTFTPQTNAPGSYGSFTVNAAGVYTYNLNNSLAAVQKLGVGESLTDTFTYTVNDGKGGTATNTIVVTINGTNDKPVVAAATASVTEDTALTATGNLPTPTDVDVNDILAFIPKTNAPGSYGSLTLNAAGVYTYTLNNNLSAVQALGVGEKLTDTFTYTVSDGKGGTATNTLTVTINGTNDAPVVAGTTASVTEDTITTASGTLPTPTDVDIHDTLAFIPQTAAPGSYGSFTLNAAGAYTYALNNSQAAVQALGVGEKLTDTFTYTVSDGKGGTATNTIVVTINGTNDNPVVAAATAQVTEDTQISASGFLPTPTDVDIHDTLLFTPINNLSGVYGTFTLGANGSYTYTLSNTLPAVQALGAGEQLKDTFIYTVTDGKGGTTTNTMTVTINGTNDVPTVGSASNTAAEDLVLSASGRLPTPQDIDITDTLTFLPQTALAGTYGSLTLAADGTYTYTLNNSSRAVQGLGVGETGLDKFTYTVSDGHGGFVSNTLTISVTGRNDTPTLSSATTAVTEDTQPTVAGALPAPHDVDVNDITTFIPKVAEPGLYGNLTIGANGTYTYVLNNSLSAVQSLGVGESLTETFTYVVLDNHGAAVSATLTVTINGTNDAPNVTSNSNSVTEDSVLTTSGQLSSSDIDAHDTVTFTPVVNLQGLYGTLNVNADGTYTYVLNNSLAAVQNLGAGEQLQDVFQTIMTDNHGASSINTLKIVVNGTNDVPTVASTNVDVAEDTQIVAQGQLPDPVDIDIHDTHTFTPVAANGNFGTITIDAQGAYVYTLNNSLPVIQTLGVGSQLSEHFTYVINDGHGGIVYSTLTITINGTNDAPEVDATLSGQTYPSLALTGSLATPTDIDLGDVVTFLPQSSVQGTYGTLQVDASGHYTYIVDVGKNQYQALMPGQTLTEQFQYTVSDGHGGTATNILTIVLNAQSSGGPTDPTVFHAVSTSNSVTEDLLVQTSGQIPPPVNAPDNDVEYVPETLTGVYGYITINADGTYTYTLNNGLDAVQSLGSGQQLTESFSYHVTSGGQTVSNSIAITVNGTNDTPVVTPVVTSVTEDASTIAVGKVIVSDVDDNDQVLTFTPKSGEAGSYGTLVLNENGTYSYILNNGSNAVQALGVGETLTDTFTVTVQDQHGGSSSTTLSVVIHGTNDAPFISSASAQVIEDTKTFVSGTLPTPHDVDIHDTLTITPQLNITGQYGTFNINADGTYSYTLNNSRPEVQGLGVGESLTDSLNYVVNDGHGGVSTSTLTIRIQGTNDIPTGSAFTGQVKEDGIQNLSGLLPAPVDPDIHDIPRYVPMTATGLYGSITIGANGYYSYVLNNASQAVQSLSAGDTGTDVFTYTISDGHGGFSTNTFTVTVNGTNDTPLLTAAYAAVTADIAPTASGTLPTPVDIDAHDILTFTPINNLSGLYGTLTVDSHGVYSYVLNANSPLVVGLGVGETATDTFTYTVSDGHGGTATNTLTITVNGTNDAPVAVASVPVVGEDVLLVASGSLPPPTDADINDTGSFVPQTNTIGLYGTLSISPTGVYSYVLNNNSPLVQGLGAGETATDTFTYRVVDNHGTGANVVLTVIINGNNDIPMVAAATASAREDIVLSSTGNLPTPTDVDIHDILTFIPITAQVGSYGTLSVDAAGHYTYTLANGSTAVQRLGVGETATDTFTYTVSDGHGGIATNTLTVTVTGTNDIPTVGAETASVTEDNPLIATGSLPTPVDVDANDTVSFIPINALAGQYGTLSLDSAGNYIYTLNNSLPAVQALGVGETTTETFTYTVRDNHGATSTNTITITINGRNDAPTVAAASASATEDTSLVATGTLPTPHDVDTNDTVTFNPVNNLTGIYGSLTIDAAGNYIYTLANNSAAVQRLGPGETATDTFTYSVSDGKGGIGTNTLTVTVTGTNDTPLVAAAADSVTEDTNLVATGTLPAPQDADINDTVSFVPINAQAGQYGSLSLDSSGNYIYTLNNALPAVQALGPGETATETFTYTVTDNHGATSTNTLTVTVNGSNDIPTVAAASASATEDTSLVATGTLPTPQDADTNDTVSFVPINAQAGQYGSLSLDSSGNYIYTLNNALPAVQALGPGETATETFTYTVTDNHGATSTNTLTVTVNGSNDIPTVAAASASATEDTSLVATGTLPTPQDADTNDTVSFVPINALAGQYGSLSLNSAGNYTYTLNNSLPAVQALGPGETATETFTYTVRDNHGATSTNTLTVTVNGSNDIPTVAAASASTTEDTSLVATGTLPTPHDVDTNDTVSFVPINAQAGQYGSLSLNSAGNYTYTLNNALQAVQALGPGETATETFTYTVTDNHGATSTNTLTVTVNGSNDIPTVAAASTNTTEDTSLVAIGTLPAPHDVDTHDTVSFVPINAQAGQYGSLSLDSAGHYIYTLNNALPAVQALGPGETATETFTYTVTDNHGATSTNTLTVTVNGSNDIPTVAAATDTVTEDSILVASGSLPPPVDMDTHDTVSFTPINALAGQYGNLSLDSAGHYTYALNNSLASVQALSAGNTTTETFTYTVTDNHGATSTNTLTLTIHGSNDIPTVDAASASVTEDTNLVATGVLPTPHDVDTGDTVSFVPISALTGQYGSLSLDNTGHYTYTLHNSLPAVQALGAGESATETFTYTVTDNHGATSSNTLTLTIHGSNDAPTVAAASASVTEDTDLVATGVLPTPHDVDTHDTVTFTPINNLAGAYGSLSVDAAGHYTYTLDNSSTAVQALGNDDTATDTFTYAVADGHGGMANNTLTVTIQGTDESALRMAVSTVMVSPFASSYSLDQDVNEHILSTGQLHDQSLPDKYDLLEGREESLLPGTDDAGQAYDAQSGHSGLMGIAPVSIQLFEGFVATPVLGDPAEEQNQPLHVRDLLSADNSMDTLLGQDEKHDTAANADPVKESTHTDTDTDASRPQESDQQIALQEHVHTQETEDTTLQQEIQEHIVRNHSS